MIDGIVDFDRGRTATQLDDLDYDEFYQIDSESSKRTVSRILSDHHDIIPGQIRSFLEIGAGTGGFTLGMLSLMDIDRAVLSDVSTKMLSICQQRLSQHQLDRKTDIQYVTYSGRDSCFAESSFDVCFGSAVLHHIMDVGNCLRDVHRALKPGGRAFFTEPNRPFHLAVLHMLTELIDWEVRAGTHPGNPDVSLLANWIAENRYNIIHTGDAEMLWFREDKHLFDREFAERLRAEAGFQRVELRALDPRNHGIDSLAFFLMQIGLTDQRSADVRQKCKELFPHYLESLELQDRTPSYLICFEKAVDDRPVDSAVVHDELPRIAASTSPYEGYFTVIQREGSLVVNGWFCSSEILRRIVLRVHDKDISIAIWKPRFDVYQKFADADRFPVYHTLFSGIDQEVEIDQVVLNAKISIEFKSGVYVDLGDHEFTDGVIVVHVSQLALDDSAR